MRPPSTGRYESSFWCPRCRTRWGFFTRDYGARYAQMKECAAGKCRPFWLRILLGRRAA